MRELLNRMTRWRIGWGWLLIAAIRAEPDGMTEAVRLIEGSIESKESHP